MQTERQKLEALRMSIMRVAEATGDKKIISLIPGSLANLGQGSVKVDRGWNRLCDEILAWIEK